MKGSWLLSAFLCWSSIATASCQAAGPAPEAAPTAAEAPAVDASAAGFTGVWRSSFGSLRLEQDEGRVRGSYSYAPGATIEGEVDGRRLRGTYCEPAGASEDVRGRLVFELSLDGETFHGTWRVGLDQPLELDDPGASDWEGERVHAVPGRVWLVILEANWEVSLDEHEYSFGAMLRAFFERVPRIEVRHRFVHDAADLTRFCGELAGLVEPVVLYISSHGGPDGLHVGGSTVTPEELGAALGDIGELRLLHLGSCALLAGDAPDRIRAAAAPPRPFPISGFVESVDWAGSALVDLTYMHLVLEQGLDPARAVEAVRAMLTFAGEPRADDLPLGGTDLVIR